MGARPLFAGPGVVLALLGALGCVDRPRLSPAAGPGDGQGPTAEVLTPGELDTVHIGKTFALDVRLTDPDGVDSIWVTLEPNINTLPRLSANGASPQSVGYTPLVPNDTTLTGDTLFVHVQGTDILGDTGAVFTRRLLIQ